MKDLLIILCTLHFCGKEFENLGKHMVDSSFDWILSEPALHFKHMSESDPHFLKSEVLPIYLAQFSSMCSYNVLCDCFGAL